ncbi:glycosyltransferase family 4 protein [Pseudomonas nitroreducens]|uniref:glycosyltransferase family 4 protein n=1 Tax=Pseudomonas nitroreducens TaxID=46680 RepID=UPI0026587A02|nr:glycosyltransferase family 4 protein [Pseudomonas nitroreducens]MCP1650445.1 rhamnosyl/mannosyltransferase [Pseudomonas nitroreducens]MCP1688397.1 rhamnosyl/mannosyltransferase [Pseudomonas nitroreducens]
MKVLHFYKTYYPDTFGGVEQVIFQICEGTSSLGVDSKVLTISNSGRQEGIIGKHRVTYCKPELELLSTPFSISSIVKLKELSASADIVHYHFPWPFMDVAHFIAKHNKPTIVTYHSDIVRQKYALKAYRALMHRFLGDVDRIVATSPNYLNSSETLSKFKEKTSIIPIGLDRKTYPTASDALLEKWQNLLPQKFFLFIGVLRYYKGLNYLIEAAKLTGYPVVIIGSGPEESSLKLLAQKLDASNVHFLGSLSDEEKVTLLKLSFATVFPSHLRAEAFGISLLEAAMHGKPMISCEIGTGTSYINTDETGEVIPPRDVSALQRAMQKLWNDPESARTKGASALHRFNELFTAQQMAEKYVEIYKSLHR